MRLHPFYKTLVPEPKQWKWATTFVVGAALVCIITGNSEHGATRPWKVWVAPQMHRVGKYDAPENDTRIELWMARGETNAFQIVVKAGSEPLSGVDVQTEALEGMSERPLPASVFRVFKEHYVQVTRSSPDYGRGNRPLPPGWYADALIPKMPPESRSFAIDQVPSFPFRVEKEENQPIWVDVAMPKEAVPGVYESEVRVVSDLGSVAVSVILHVWPFTLPVVPTLKSSFGMHEPWLFDPDMEHVLLEHRVMPVNIDPAQARNLQRDGLNIVGLRIWGNSDAARCRMDSPPASSVFEKELALYPPELPVYVYSADEVSACPELFETLRQWATNMHAANPRIQHLVTVPPTLAFDPDQNGSSHPPIDIWVILPKLYEMNRSRIDAARSAGGEIWSYTALVQDAYSPKWELDFRPMNYRILPGFLSQALGLSGLLYWRVDLWTQAPWRDVSGFMIEQNRYPGEGMLVYPGVKGSSYPVLPSMRLKWIRQGVNDFEYVAILKRMGEGTWAMDHIRPAAVDWKNWSDDDQVAESVRRELGNEITRLTQAAN